MTDLLPHYFHLLLCAQHASEAVDHHDLRSEDPESKRVWKRLLQEQRNHSVALVEFVRDHHLELIRKL